MAGHKAAFASLRVLPLPVPSKAGSGGKQNGGGPAAPAAAAAAPAAPRVLVWQGRTVAVGCHELCALTVGGPGSALISRCHAVLQPTAGQQVWLTDCSRHGTLVLPLPQGSAPGSGAIAAAELDALPWEAATMLQAGDSMRLPAGRPTALVVGLDRAEWLAGAKASMSAELAAKGAALLLYEQRAAAPGGPGAAKGEEQQAGAWVLEQLPPELAAALGRVPFARTPGRERRGPLLERNDRAQRNKRIRDKYGDARPRVEDAPLPASFNIFQLAGELAKKRSRPAAEADKGSPKKRKKRVRFSEKLEIAADGGGAGSKAAGSEPAAAQTGGKLAAAPVAAPVGALAAAAEKQRKGKAGSGGSKKWAGKSQKKKKGSGSTRVPRAQSVLSRMNGRSGGKKAGKGKQGRG